MLQMPSRLRAHWEPVGCTAGRPTSRSAGRALVVALAAFVWLTTHAVAALAYGKQTPANGTGGLARTVTLTWDYVPLATYRYCVSLTASCPSGGWVSTGSTESATVSGLDGGTTYYWQVVAFTSDLKNPTIPLNGGTWWSFTTLFRPPTFNKTSPANGATAVSTTATVRWEAVATATSYEVCANTAPTCPAGGWVNVGNVTSRTQHGLDHGTTYYWQVRAVNASGSIDADSGTWWSFTTIHFAPGAFTKGPPASGAAGVATSPTLFWSESLWAATYQVCVDTTNDGACGTSWTGGVTGRSVSPVGLSPATTYYWQVRAANVDGVTTDADGGAWFSFTTRPGTFGKLAPASGATGMPASPAVSWTASAGATNYEVCADQVNDSACSASWLTVGNVTSTTWPSPPLAYDALYYWQVRAVYAGGSIQADSGTWFSFRTKVQEPAAFSKTAPANGATGLPASTTLTWGASARAASYEYCVDTTNDGACATSWTSAGTNASAVPIGLSAGTTYYWQVRAVNAGGAVDADTSTWWSFTTLAPPRAFGKTIPADTAMGVSTAVTVRWDPSARATSYEVCANTAPTCPAGWWVDVGNVTSVSRHALDHGTTYFWQVRAVNSAGRTDACNRLPVYTRPPTPDTPDSHDTTLDSIMRPPWRR